MDKPVHISLPETADYWDNKEREHEVESAQSVALNPHQFGDQGTLFHASLGQPDMGVVRGHPQARMYRAIHIPEQHAGTPEDVLAYASQSRRDTGHPISLGIHWQHDLPTAQDLSAEAERNNWGRHGDAGVSVMLEADHPGHEHVLDFSHNPESGPPEELGNQAERFGPAPKSASQSSKDWKVVNDTVGPHNMLGAMLPEVPVRPGAPMRVHAVHLPHPETSGEYVRNPVQFRGYA